MIKVAYQELGELILLVLRHFCNDRDVIDWVDEVCQVGLNLKKSVRLDDPGKIAMVGYTPGSRSSPSIMWSKNLLRKPTALFDSPTNLREFDFNCSSVFALMWNMMQRQLPTEVLDALKDFSTKCNMAMDAAGVMDSYYGIQDGNGVYYEFHNTELAPPQGNFAKNYARFCHNESNATNYCFAWTTSRQNEIHEGGEFFIADYAIKVQPSADTLVVWRGKDYHGTTLPHCDPQQLNTDFHQVGLSITISGRVKSYLKRWRSRS